MQKAWCSSLNFQNMARKRAIITNMATGAGLFFSVLYLFLAVNCKSILQKMSASYPMVMAVRDAPAQNLMMLRSLCLILSLITAVQLVSIHHRHLNVYDTHSAVCSF